MSLSFSTAQFRYTYRRGAEAACLASFRHDAAQDRCAYPPHPLNFRPVKTPIPSNAPKAEDAATRIAPGPISQQRSPESWARELPAPLTEPQVEAACRELLSVPVRERREVLHRRAGEHDAAGRMQIVAALVERGYAYRHSNPHAYLRIAQVANQCAYRYLCAPLELRPAGRQLRAGALGFLANAYRILGRFADAERCWRRVRSRPGVGKLPPMLVSLLREMEASLARDRRYFGRAIALLEEARRLAEGRASAGERGRVLLILAKTHDDRGDTEKALLHLTKALEFLPENPSVPLSMVVAVLHNLTSFLLDLGQTPRAARMFLDFSWMYEATRDELIRLRGQALLGRLQRELGAYEEAVKLLEEVRHAYVVRSMPNEASLIGLELALAYASQHRDYQVLVLAREMYPVFTAHGVPRDATMALLEFVDAAERYQAKTEVISDVLRRLRHPEERRPAPEP